MSINSTKSHYKAMLSSSENRDRLSHAFRSRLEDLDGTGWRYTPAEEKWALVDRVRRELELPTAIRLTQAQVRELLCTDLSILGERKVKILVDQINEELMRKSPILRADLENLSFALLRQLRSNAPKKHLDSLREGDDNASAPELGYRETSRRLIEGPTSHHQGQTQLLLRGTSTDTRGISSAHNSSSSFHHLTKRPSTSSRHSSPRSHASSRPSSTHIDGASRTTSGRARSPTRKADTRASTSSRPYNIVTINIYR